MLLSGFVFSQSLSHITLSGGSNLTSFSFTTDQKVIINISPDGKVLEWGIEMPTWRTGYIPGKLDPYMARVTYYDQQVDSAYIGKVKSIGTCQLIYYNSLENSMQRGKLKKIGNIDLDYFNDYENEALRGKLKFIGSQVVSFYSSTDNEGYRGKLKSVGSTQLSYFSSLDDQLIRGKIKSIGSVSYAWYTSFETSRFHAGLKIGSYTQSINGIIYYIR